MIQNTHARGLHFVYAHPTGLSDVYSSIEEATRWKTDTEAFEWLRTGCLARTDGLRVVQLSIVIKHGIATP